MPTPLGFETADDRQAEAATLKALQMGLADAVVQTLTEFADASALHAVTAIAEHPADIGWYLSGGDTGPLHAPVVVTLAFDDIGATRVPVLDIVVSGDGERFSRNVSALGEILHRQTGQSIVLRNSAGTRFWPPRR